MKSKTKSAKRGMNKKVKNLTRKASKRVAMTVTDIKSRFKELDNNLREFIKKNNLNNPSALGKHVSRQWQGLFKKPLTNQAAEGLAKHYLNLHAPKRTRKSGGSLQGAPLDYVMRPGLPGVATYGVFPTEIGGHVKSVQHLDVYYNSALGRSCGYEDTTAKVPADMGSNQVAPPVKGGARRTRRTRGGDFATALAYRPYGATNPSNPLQRGMESWEGKPVWPTDKGDPSDNMLSLRAPGTNPINPRIISVIDKDITKLAGTSSPYPEVKTR